MTTDTNQDSATTRAGLSDARRVPWIAMALSLLATGVGHIYCGRVGKGLILFCAWFLIPMLAIAAAFLTPATSVLVGLIVCPLIGMLALYFYAAISAYFEAKRIGTTYQLQEYNRIAVYGLLILVGLVYPIVVTSMTREFVFEAFCIPTRSMSPSLLCGDRILANKIARKGHYPQRGELVVFRNPGQGAEFFVKRVVGLAGDSVEIERGRIRVNGQPLAINRVPAEALAPIKNQVDGNVFYEQNGGSRYLVAIADDDSLSDDQKENLDYSESKIPDRNVFLVGDNRDRSLDSRSFGPVHVEDIVAYVQYVFSPAESWSRFGACRQ